VSKKNINLSEKPSFNNTSPFSCFMPACREPFEFKDIELKGFAPFEKMAPVKLKKVPWIKWF